VWWFWWFGGEKQKLMVLGVQVPVPVRVVLVIGLEDRYVYDTVGRKNNSLKGEEKLSGIPYGSADDRLIAYSLTR